MRLFWRDQLSLILFFTVQMLLVPFVYWLTGEGRPVLVVLYGVLLSGSVLAVYLGFRYVTHRAMYKELSAEEPSGEFLNPPLGEAPLPEAFHERTAHYERLYREQLHRQQSRTEQHLTFMNRWVHQMKTPLSVIQLTLSEVENEPAESIREELDRIRKGLDMVLYTARLEHFEQDFAVQAIGLRAAAGEAVAENRTLFIRKGITPKFEIGSEVRVYTDAKWFRFMLGQILTNAVNYSGGPGKAVHLTAEDAGEYIKLRIRDEGIGIAPEDIGRVFHPYFTGERGRQYRESTGMGLYLVREIAGKLGHEVELKSAPGEGTTISLTLRKAHANEGTS
ncbi:MAG: sensor histidine kinase [Paenibacillus macerans]|uniref:histidine kinase n=1 Tax=Paenibacillus macerans TaxID=44252 RepID=A0A090ZAY4_PAEMA|nr:sensor histidine kinase [Paenibacillus macerans]KFN08439.1 histidine kinase-, DNA gyrase B-, and HSP90-like ATPase family protein [Paenibacillus macerans]MBS5913582.1 sensor histidine kinase [Paenibacillus macerans]MCY7557611.1 sensor histidine kinase [Paenibacillus macerans]MDU7475410.1 sensor histidine kinase [Paenibacillus macerans]MEC0137482.1 sensor histidine kinase [Paenibacillus macerans]